MRLRDAGVLVLSLTLVAFQAKAQDHSAHTQHDAPAPAAITPGDRTSELEHVAPDPPQLEMRTMPYDQMVRMMAMDDRQLSAHVVIDQMEWRNADGADASGWDGYAWYGRDEGKLWLKSEGERASGETRDATAELLFDRTIARWWSVQAGARHDFGEGPSRTWFALGVRGLAPYFFHVDATAYVGEQARAALRFRTEYELLFTQRLILQPLLELNAYSKDDPERGLGSGLSDAQFGLRLRYEFRRQFAPYFGLSYVKRLGETGDLARAGGEDASEAQFVAGFRIWF